MAKKKKKGTKKSSSKAKSYGKASAMPSGGRAKVRTANPKRKAGKSYITKTGR